MMLDIYIFSSTKFNKQKQCVDEISIWVITFEELVLVNAKDHKEDLIESAD